MAATLKWLAPTEAQQTALDTQLDGLTNGSLSAASGAIDNATDIYQYMAVDIALASLSPTGTPSVGIWLFYSNGGTNFEDVSINAFHALAASPSVTTGAGAKLIMSRQILILPFKFKIALSNATNVSFAGTLNTVKYRRFNEQAV